MQSGVLLCALLFSEMVQGLAFSLSFHWAIGNNADFQLGHVPDFCKTQAIVLQMSDVATAFFVRLDFPSSNRMS